MIESKEILIGGSKYTVSQMPARRALKVQAKLMKLLGNAFGELLIASKAKKDKQDAFLPKIISCLVDALDVDTFDAFILELVEFYVRKDGREITQSSFDIDFAGKINDLFILLQFILEVNYADFFSEKGILKDLIANQETETETDE